MARVSVVIVTWNGRELLERFLPSVAATDYPDFEIIVADNASTDGTATWLTEHYPSVRVVQHPENWLFARGNNAAIAHATGEYVCLLNNDVEVPPHWLSPLVEEMEHHPDVAAVQPKLLQFDDRTLFEYAGASGGFLDAVGYPFTRGRLFSTLEKDKGQYDNSRDVFWASGACFLTRRDAYESAGGLDERFGMHMEEIDLCWRFWRSGWRVRVVPQSRVYHLGGASLPQGNPQKTYYNFRNSLLMLYKNLPASVWRGLFRRRRAVDVLAYTQAAALRTGEATVIRQAYRDARSLFPSYSAVRPSDDELLVLPPYRGLVTFDYYARGRKHFNSLPADRFLPLDSY